jgi:exonuclease SbcC
VRLLRLTIKNFLSYGSNPQVVDFTVSPIISFVGSNGHGKSALLESITWALWGYARKTQGVTKSDDMIISIGADDMFVELEFAVATKWYKVRRTCKKKHNRVLTGLQIIALREEGEERDLSEAHQKSTQEVIDKIIGINYDVFINTVYLKQNQSNEFSKKTAKERKEIICSLLKIDKIEEGRQKIVEDIRKISHQKDILIALEDSINKKNREEEIAECEKECQALGESFALLSSVYEGKEQQANTLKNEQKSFSEAIELLHKEMSFIEKEKEVFYTKYLFYKNEYDYYKQAKKRLKSIVETDAKRYNQEKSLLQKEIENIDLAIEKSLCEEAVQREKLDSDYQKKLVLLDKRIQEHLIAKEKILDGLSHELSHASLLFDLLSGQMGTECLICGSFLSEEKKKGLNSHSLEEKKLHLEKKIGNKKKELASDLSNMQEEKLSIESTYRERSLFLEKNKEKKDIFYKEKKQALLEKIINLGKTISDSQEKAFLLKEIDDFTNKKVLYSLRKIISSFYEKKFVIKDLRTQLIENKKASEEMTKSLLLVENEREEGNIKKNKSKEVLISRENYLSLIQTEYEKEKKEIEKIKQKITLYNNDLKIKSNLASILSKNNLQAAIIEEAIPFIESEANSILGALTEGGSKIYIDSMRDLKSGNIKETLDIRIADHVGIRPYEFFSGGEAFRIDLALRIALVKLLVKSSGSYIKTFIIDEGFGSQDSQNLENIIQTLYLLQNEFDLIIIISHLQDMKEQFPVQFTIEKTVEGSKISQMW